MDDNRHKQYHCPSKCHGRHNLMIGFLTNLDGTECPNSHQGKNLRLLFQIIFTFYTTSIMIMSIFHCTSERKRPSQATLERNAEKFTMVATEYPAWINEIVHQMKTKLFQVTCPFPKACINNNPNQANQQTDHHHHLTSAPPKVCLHALQAAHFYQSAIPQTLKSYNQKYRISKHLKHDNNLVLNGTKMKRT